jgi:hypothetical protein
MEGREEKLVSTIFLFEDSIPDVWIGVAGADLP